MLLKCFHDSYLCFGQLQCYSEIVVGINRVKYSIQGQAILGSALVGSLAFTFTDSFWFNAVETEVYAMATLIMSVMFYLGLRWEQDMINHVEISGSFLFLL